ncbi:nucleoside-diphosphate-sugar epimerase [Ochrobactrum daejeonense]|jgi:nucleoside-diphosphate-sugar epimerase|uniref:Nucleoside-diphosphate-sugar epimerase n=1 Tax=Brucella daejeonensis TaxID=659015 RepID=A0A7W9ENJ5_9HYPH|nr:NAD-dependent epimerase/dehydratase family protein [Brucella daejeonensis]MBB5704638.1 nucleoside-diphosphate-sugar epimerase [Brucella daejeonensis]
MKVLLTGASGYIGSATLDALVAAGHDVVGVVRSESKADGVRERGAIAAPGDITDPTFLRELAATVDGVIHLASPGDQTSAEAEDVAITAILDGLGQTGKPLVSTAGIWDHGSGGAITEATAFRAPQITAWRPAITQRVLGAVGVRSSVISPATAYGRGDALLHVITNGPRIGSDEQALAIIGGGEQHWTNVHVDDLAELYVLALEKAPAGTYLIGANGTNPTVREITIAASEAIGLQGRVVAEGVAATVDRLGVLGEALLLDQQVVSTGTQQLGWKPSRPTIIEHIANRASHAA